MIEIVARIGDSIVEVACVPARGSYVAHDGSQLVVAGRAVVPSATIGLVTFTLQRVEREAPPVPRPRIAKRPLAYLAASLAVQLAIWLAAVTTEPFERLERPRHRIVRLTHIHPAEPPPPKPVAEKPEPPKPAAEAVHAAAPKRRSKREAPDDIDRLAGNPAAQIAHLARTFDAIDVKGQLAMTDGPVVDPTDDSGGFGGTGGHMKFDDTTYKVERWALPTFVRTHKGELAPVPAIEWCDEDSCLTRGALPIRDVLGILARHEKQIAQCYREHTGDLAGNVRVRFPIGADGKVTGKLGTETGPVGYGTGTVGRCVAKIAQGIRWPQADDETYVFIGLAFRPASG